MSCDIWAALMAVPLLAESQSTVKVTTVWVRKMEVTFGVSCLYILFFSRGEENEGPDEVC